MYSLIPTTTSTGIPYRVRRPTARAAVAALAAISYGLSLSILPVDAFMDRENYLRYAESAAAMLEGRAREGFLPLLANEPVWLLINAVLSRLVSPEDVLRLIILMSGSVVAFVTLQARPKDALWISVFLLLPQVMMNHITHLRQGLAVAIFLIAWFRASGVRKWTLMGLTPFVHSSFFIVLLLLGLAWGSSRLRLAWGLQAALFIGVSLGIGLGIEQIAAAAGARQANEYRFAAGQVSGLGFAFWCAVVALMVVEGKAYIRQHAFALGLLIFYLITYFMVESGVRVFESGLMVVLLAGLQLRRWRRVLFTTAIMGYLLFSWLPRLDMPALGF